MVLARVDGTVVARLVMRGGLHGPNYGEEYVAFAQVLLQKNGIPTGLIIDCSHANSNKDHTLQRVALLDVAGQIRNGTTLIAGIMLESFLSAGRQEIDDPATLKYGVSVTDKCIGWDETEELILHFAKTI